METEQLAASLFRRVDAFFRDQDVDAVLASEALAEAHALADATDADAVVAVAYLCWCRFFAGDQDLDTVSAYLNRFLALRPAHPEVLPVLLSAALDLVDGGGAGEGEFDPFFLYSLGGGFASRFEVTGDRLDLDRAVAAMTACAARLPEGEELHGAASCRLGGFLTLRLRLDGPDGPDDVEAARVLTACLAASRPGQGHRPVAMANLVDLRATQYLQRPGPERADLLIEVMSRTWHDPDAGDDVRAHVAELTTGLLAGLGEHVRLGEPDRMIALYRLGVAATEPGHPAHVHALLELGVALASRAETGTTTVDLDEAIEVLRRAAPLAEQLPLTVPRALAQTRLCLVHLARFERFQDPLDVEHGVAAGRAALGPARGEQPLTDYCVVNLANALLSAHLCGVPGALAESIELLLTAVDSGSTDLRGRARVQLGTAYRLLFEETGDRAAIDEAVRRHRSAGDHVPPDRPHYVDHLNLLAIALSDRSRRYGSDEDLDEAIELYAAAAAVRPDGHPEHLLDKANLVRAHLARYQRHGDPDSATRALAIAREITAPELPPGMAVVQLGAVGHALLTAYELFGSARDLDDGIAVIRRGIAGGVRPDPSLVNQLGGALLRRFERTGAAADAVEAVDAFREALAAVGPTEVLRPEILSGLCEGLGHLYHLTGDPAHLDAAVEVGIESIAGLEGTTRHARHSTSLANAYTTRFRVRHDLADLDRAVEAHRGVLAATRPNEPGRVRYLSNLGGALADRFGFTGQAGDLDEAVALLRECVSRTTSGETQHAVHSYNLAAALLNRHRAGHDPADLAEAVAALSVGAASVASPALDRIQAASWWAVAAAGHDVASSLAGYEQVVALLPVLAWHGLHREDQQRQLLALVGVASHAAATALTAGRPERAVELLEQGRSVLWSQVLDLRTDLLALRDVRPDLARRLAELRDGLDEAPAIDPTPATRDRRMTLARQWDETVAEVRGLPGLADFLRPPPFAELLTAATGGPVVIVNVSPLRCDALVLTTRGVDVVPLSDLTAVTATERAEELAAAARAAHDVAGIIAHNTVLNDVLAWLWRAVAQPVLDHLGPTPRLWWCPTGAMTRLPLHAAGIPGTSASVPHRTVSSYTPTIRALSLARRDKPAERDGTLVVAVPDAADAAPLDVEPEVAVLTELSRGTCTVRRSADAERHRVLADLQRHTHVHFACHGVADARQPSTSGLVLHDELLTVADVSRLHLSGELAYLSACDTASGGDLPDESLHLGAALQLAGYRNVVATLWPIRDTTAAEVARGFYQRLGTTMAGDQAGYALHRAVHDLRARGWDTLPSAWVPYIHVGP
ncbi:CHAT domain-containing tetratricopeptide repeat protein [Actinosynnema sp. NPDC023794]